MLSRVLRFTSDPNAELRGMLWGSCGEGGANRSAVWAVGAGKVVVRLDGGSRSGGWERFRARSGSPRGYRRCYCIKADVARPIRPFLAPNRPCDVGMYARGPVGGGCGARWNQSKWDYPENRRSTGLWSAGALGITQRLFPAAQRRPPTHPPPGSAATDLAFGVLLQELAHFRTANLAHLVGG